MRSTSPIRPKPPVWADRFLEWYCNPDLLEEIQGDAYELFYRTVPRNKRKADLSFIWNILRFFRWKNIKRSKRHYYSNSFSQAMLRNIFKVAFRNFFRQPGHSLFNLFGLSTGFFCALLILTWVNYEYSFDRFHKDNQQLFKVISHLQANGSLQTFGVASASMDVSSVPEVKERVVVSDGKRWPHELCFRPEGKADECIYLNGIYSDESFFSAFDFPIVSGSKNPLKANNGIAISQSMASKLFGNENPVGKVIKVDNHLDVSIESVFKDVPGNSSIPFEFVMPFHVLKKLWGINDNQFNSNFFQVYLRTSTEVTADALTAKLNDKLVLTDDLKANKISYQAYPFTDWRLKSKFENGVNTGGRIEYVRLFSVIGALVLLMAVINFVNMATARATTRAKEIGVRKVTGAFRTGIIMQFLGESFVIVLTSFLIALAAAHTILPRFNQLLNEQISVNWFNGWMPVYLLTGLILVALCAGLYPALVMSSFQPVKILKNYLSSANSGSQRLRKALLVVQLSVSIGIIIFSSVMYYQLSFVTTQNLGFERANTIRVEPTISIFRNFEAFKNELFKNPSVISVGTSNQNPLGAEGRNTGVRWPGKATDASISFKTIGCSFEFPETIGLKVIKGKSFLSKPADSLYNEVLVTEDAVKTMALTDPIGEHIEIGESKCVIIGVVNDFHTESLHETRLPVILYRTDYLHTSAVYVRYQPGTTKESFDAVAAAYKTLEPSFTMKYWFQDDAFDELYKTEMIASRLVLLFTVISVFIAVIGVAGLSTFNIMRKTKEMSIRRVFGASVAQVMSLLSNEFSLLLAGAIAVAGPAAWYFSNQWLSDFAYRIPIPWWIFPLTFSVMALVIVLIIFIQGFKTVSSNPSKVLRSE